MGASTSKKISKNPMATHPIASPSVQNPHVILPRDRIEDFDDPYIPDEQRPANTVCTRCGAVYEHQHWRFDAKERTLVEQAGVAKEVVCPGCRKVAERNPQGIVTLTGDYWQRHREEILNLIRNEEERAMETNPLQRIIDIREEHGELIVETTNEKLAQRLGRRIDQAHNGDVEYQWSKDNHLVRVRWHRTLTE